MQKGKSELRLCVRIISIVLLMSFWKFPIYAEQPMEHPMNSFKNEMRYYSDLEVDLLIEELTEAAIEAIEKAAGEAARAAFLESLEREAAALHEAQRWRLEAQNNLLAIKANKKNGRKNIFFATVTGILGGIAVGVAGTMILGSR